MELILCRVPQSHRKRDKIEFLLGFKPYYYWTWNSENQFIFLKEEDFLKVKDLVNKCKKEYKLSKCLYFDEKYAPTQPYDNKNI